MKLNRLWSTLVLVLAVGVGGCGSGSSAYTQRGPSNPGTAKQAYGAPPAAEPMAAPPADAPYAPTEVGNADQAAPSSPTTMAPGGYGQPAPSPAAPPSKSSAGGEARATGASPMRPRDEMPPPDSGSRPGLATQWGESRWSHVTTSPFVRADEGHPFVVASLFYNDQEGARAMARSGGYRPYGTGSVSVAGNGLTVALRDEHGDPLPGYVGGDRVYAIGEAGRRYTIVITNHSSYRFEAVASVDGLDVIDGKPAGFAKRGYLIAPYGTVEIDGFRQSDDAVAAFRFGSVRDSYAARTGSDRNVGVIGVAFFHERGNPAWPWSPEEIQRRQSADPFPGRYATPPPPR